MALTFEVIARELLIQFCMEKIFDDEPSPGEYACEYWRIKKPDIETIVDEFLAEKQCTDSSQ